MKIIGITGGIGCGKSTVLAWIKENHQAAILETDRIAHELMEPGKRAYTDIVRAFGEGILAPDGRIDRKALGGIVFSDEEQLKLLNSLTHPAVKAYVRERISEEEKKETELVVVESALLLEDHYDAICDEIWYIYTSEPNRRERLKSSRGLTDEKITEILGSQSSEQFYLDGSDRVIHNDGDFAETGACVERALKEMKERI